MVQRVCLLLVGMYALSMSAQEGVHLVPMSDFVSWLGVKHAIAVTYTDDISTFPDIELDTTAADGVHFLRALERIEGIEFFLDDKKKLFVRKRKTPTPYLIDLNIQVVDKETLRPIELVAVSIPESIYGAYTDAEGEVTLSVPHTYSSSKLLVSMIGYTSRIIDIEDYQVSGKILLERQSVDFEDILIEDRRNMVTSSHYGHNLTLRSSDQINIGGLGGKDPLRDVQLMPGVVAHRETDAGISIRGSESQQTLVLLDEIPIYNAGHYFGIFGAINAHYIDQATLYKNNLPIAYGEKNGGMLKIESQPYKGNAPLTVEGDINLITSSLTLGGRIDSTWSFGLAGRSSYRNVAKTIFSTLGEESEPQRPPQNFVDVPSQRFNGSTPDFHFYDINGNIGLRTSGTWNIEGNIYLSSDQLSNQFVSDIFIEKDRGVIKLLAQSTEEESWQNRGASILSTTTIGNKWILKNDGYYSDYQRYGLSRVEVLQERGGSMERFKQKSETENMISELSLRSYVKGNINQSVVYTGGVEIKKYESLFNSSDIVSKRLNVDESAMMYSIFSNIDINMGGSWQIGGGLRATYYDLTNRPYLSPRLDISNKITPTTTLKASVGRQYQLAQLLAFENLYSRNLEVWTLSNDQQVPVSDMDHLMLGSQWRMGRWLIDLELYHRHTRGLTQVASNQLLLSADGGVPSLNQDTYRLYRGSGRTRGMDLLVHYTGKHLSGSLSYTLSKATHRYAAINMGRAFPSYLDSRHQIQWSMEFKKNHWSFGSTWLYASGRTYTDLNKFDNEGTREMSFPEDRISRLPDYIRLDFGVGYDVKFRGVSSTFSASLINTLNRQNVSYIQYAFSLPTQSSSQQSRGTVVGNTSNLLSRTLNFSWRFSF